MTVNVTNQAITVSGSSTVSFTENGTGTVAMYTHNAPTGETVTWDLSGTDSSLFSIDTSGNLTFNSAPDFETPPCDGSSNTCNVTVEAKEGSTVNGNLAVTVNVTNSVADDPILMWITR